MAQAYQIYNIIKTKTTKTLLKIHFENTYKEIACDRVQPKSPSAFLEFYTEKTPSLPHAYGSNDPHLALWREGLKGST